MSTTRKPAKRLNLKGLLERLDELREELGDEKGECAPGKAVYPGSSQKPGFLREHAPVMMLKLCSIMFAALFSSAATAAVPMRSL